MPTVDRWVVHRACELLGEHSASVGEDIARFAINLSGQSLQDESFLGFVTEQIKASGLAPGVLCFELTETATIGNLVKAQNFMRSLQDLGCQFALDDFGTGVSSLAYLKDLSVNYLKIDGSFVRDAVTNARSESMIKAIAQLAKVMCMETIAEYVETDVLRARMADLGGRLRPGICDGAGSASRGSAAGTGHLRGLGQRLGRNAGLRSGSESRQLSQRSPTRTC